MKIGLKKKNCYIQGIEEDPGNILDTFKRDKDKGDQPHGNITPLPLLVEIHTKSHYFPFNNSG